MNIFFFAAIVLVAAMLLALYRVINGPTVYDQFLAASMCGTYAIFTMGMIGFSYGRPDMFIDILLAYALLNFVAVIVVSKFLEKRRVMR